MQWSDAGTDVRTQPFKSEFATWINQFHTEDVPIIVDPLLSAWNGYLTADALYCGWDAFQAITLVFDEYCAKGITFRSWEMQNELLDSLDADLDQP
jgi:hypothetical protein